MENKEKDPTQDHTNDNVSYLKSFEPNDAALSHSNIYQLSISNNNYEVLLSKALSVIRFRKTRDNLFNDSEIFSDPTWDMILELYVAQAQRVKISVSGLCIASQFSRDIAYRWLKVLEVKQLVEITIDKKDNTRSFVKLSKQAVHHVTVLLSAYQ